MKEWTVPGSYPEDFSPAESIRLSSGNRSLLVPKTRIEFEPWQGAPPSSTYNGKPIVTFGEEYAFAELATLWSFFKDGWQGVWTGGGTYRVHFWQKQPLPIFSTSLTKLITKLNLGPKYRNGMWDLVCWRETEILFCELKREKKDRLSQSQMDWAIDGIAGGLEPENFLVVQWHTKP